MGVRSWEHTGLHGKRGTSKRRGKEQNGKEGMGLREKDEGKEGKRVGEKMFGGDERERESRKRGERWEKERRTFLEDRKVSMEEVERRREQGEDWFGEMVQRHRELQKMERWEKIRVSRCNKWYKVIKGEEILGYSKKN